MDENTIIQIKSVEKDFILPLQQVSSLKSNFTNLFRRRQNIKTIQRALRGVSFEVKRGEFFGIVGRNGSGKSTLLKLIAGIYQPNKGSVKVRGRLVPFIELGVGFNPELTGRENVYLNGAMLGFNNKQVDSRYNDIVKFAELEKFMDQKLKNYSSGMQVRLAFSCATMAEADILLVDEVLAVGDADFQRKCFEYFKSLKKEQKTVVFVTHDMNAVREFCDKAVLIDEGRVAFTGTAEETAREYTKLFTHGDAKPVLSLKKEKRWGTMAVRYDSVKIIRKNGKLLITLTATAHKEIISPIFGFLIKNAASEVVLGTNSVIKRFNLDNLNPGKKVRITWQMEDILNDGIHFIDIAITQDDGATVYDWWEEAASFNVHNPERTPYLISPPITLSVD